VAASLFVNNGRLILDFWAPVDDGPGLPRPESLRMLDKVEIREGLGRLLPHERTIVEEYGES
jgi:hypothetical protein